MDAQTLATIIVAAIGSPLLLELARRLIDWLKGREQAKRSEVDRAHEKIARERTENDVLRRDLRIAHERASVYRRMLLEAPCIEASAIPSWDSFKER